MLQAGLEAGLDELIEISIQYALCISGFDARTKILNSRLIQNIGSDLTSPADIRFGILQLLLGFISPAHLGFIQSCSQHRHGFSLVPMLRSVVLALYYDTGGQVGDPNSGIRPVHMLATRTARSIGIDPEIRRIDFDFYAVINFRVCKYRCKRSVSTISGIERRFPNQAVHAGFCSQMSVGVITIYSTCGAFDSGYFTLRSFDQFCI